MDHHTNLPEFHLHSEHGVNYDPFRPVTPDTLQLPKRHREHENLSSSPKRPRSVSNTSEANISTPGSRAGWIHGTEASPSPRAFADAIPPNHAQNFDGLVMDWAPTNVHSGQETSNRPSESIICYGTILDSKACFQQPKQAAKLATTGQEFCLFSIVPTGSHYALSHESANLVAVLDMATCRALRQLIQRVPDVELGAVAQSTELSLARNKPSGKRLIIPVSVNIYGPISVADQVGSTLSSFSYFLQHPIYLPPNFEYYNPQMYHRSGDKMENLTHLVGITDMEFKAKAISDEVQHVLESLETLVYDDAPLTPNQPTIIQPEAVNTPLKSHQVTALRFIQQREHHEHCQKVHQALRFNIQLPTHLDIPSYGMGGILADVMGLGKTLTMISAIVSTLEQSRSRHFHVGARQATVLSSATLIAVSSMQVLDVWETEITSHVKAGALRTYKFHGKDRATNPKDLQDYDIVLTTYGVLSADSKGRSVLHQVQWHRVVLDEAHWIRNQSSKQFKATVDLKSIRRWCLTGTPIQNRLDDLVSLLTFLHFHPFCQQSVFQRHILEPLRRDTRGHQLRGLLSAICLRRSDKLLNLPDPILDQVSILLQTNERDAYNNVLKQCERDIDTQVSSQAKIKKFSILFASIMKLRRLCNHGTHPVVSNKLLGADIAGGGYVDEGCSLCDGNGEDKLDLGEGEICPQCGRDPSLSSFTRPRSPSRSKSPSMSEKADIAASPAYTTCSSSPYYSQNTEQQTSSKLCAVIDRLKQTEFGSKSLVFSYWTATLDLLERYMEAAGISYLRIDGRVDSTQRLRILEAFKTTQVPVLLMTIQTGAVGLNLTAANYVHIVEPQWNPSVEEQAIARAIRMGQTRRVTVVRYMVKSSVEENIVNLQKRKRNLAKFTLDGTDDEGISGTLDDLKFVLNFGSA